ncbi:MAG: TonB-dependent receptor, partial [Maricaulaceae bacterium]
MSRTLLLAAASGAALFAGPAGAQDSETDDHDVIIVTGTATEAARDETLQAIEVLSVDDVLDRFDGSLGATLADLPGISTTSFGPAVGRPIIRGLGGDRVRVLTNGVGLVDASKISVDHASTTEALDAERIDILRGPAAIAYGGNAIGGVINVIDGRIPSAPAEDGLDGQVYGGYTSVDEGSQIAGRARTGSGPLVFQLEASHREAGDFDIPGFAESAILRAMEEDEDEEHEQATGTIENSGYTFDTVGGGVSLVGDWGFFGVSVRDYDAEYGLPSHDHEESEEEEEGDAMLTMEQTRWDSRGRIDVALGPFDHLDFAGGFAEYEHAELEPTGEVGTLFTNEGWEARAALVNESERWSGSVGVQALSTDFSASGEEAFVPPVETSDLGVFVAQRYDAGGYGFEGGARVETRELEPTSGADRSFTTYSLASGVFLQPSDDTFLGLSLARTERAPTDAEFYSNGPHAATSTFEIGDADLGKETGWALDGTYRTFQGEWVFEAGLFYSQFEDFIFLTDSGEVDPDEELPIFRYMQDDASLWGGELFAEGPLG